MSDKVEGEQYITLDLIWPIHTKIMEIFSEQNFERETETNENSLTLRMMKLGADYLKKNANDFLPVFEHRVMTLLNPMLKKLKSFKLSESINIHSKVEAYIANNHIALARQNVTPETPELEQRPTVTVSDFLQHFIELDSDAQVEQTPQSELDLYIKEKITHNVDLPSWWLDHSKIYPNLYRMFLKMSCIPASSASSERLFSTTGNIITDKRSLILPDNVNNLLIARNSL